MEQRGTRNYGTTEGPKSSGCGRELDFWRVLVRGRSSVCPRSRRGNIDVAAHIQENYCDRPNLTSRMAFSLPIAVICTLSAQADMPFQTSSNKFEVKI